MITGLGRRAGARSVRPRLALRPVVVVSTAALMAVLAPAGCSGGSSGAASSKQPAALVGVHWVLASVRHEGRRTAIPERLDAWLEFGPDGRFVAADGLNAISGRYRYAEARVTTSEVASTLAGYTGDDPVRLAAIGGMRALTVGPGAAGTVGPVATSTVVVAAGGLMVSAAGDELSFESRGRAAHATGLPSAPPTTGGPS